MKRKTTVLSVIGILIAVFSFGFSASLTAGDFCHVKHQMCREDVLARDYSAWKTFWYLNGCDLAYVRCAMLGL